MGKTPKRFPWQNGAMSGTKLVVGLVGGALLLVVVFQALNQLA
ncbi:MAG: hypothetical protein ABIQ47_03035 [Tepidiformaceae bacterium]